MITIAEDLKRHMKEKKPAVGETEEQICISFMKVKKNIFILYIYMYIHDIFQDKLEKAECNQNKIYLLEVYEMYAAYINMLTVWAIL